MLNCPFCLKDLREAPLEGGRCPFCSGQLGWGESAASPAHADAAYAFDPSRLAPSQEQEAEAEEAPLDSKELLRATLHAIVRRGAEYPEASPSSSTLPESENPFVQDSSPPSPSHVAPAYTASSNEAPPRAYDQPVPSAAPHDSAHLDTIHLPNQEHPEDLPPDPAGHVSAWAGMLTPNALQNSPRLTIKAASSNSIDKTNLVIRARMMASPSDAGDASAGVDYELLERIGEGGMGVVYTARQASIDRTVAIKMLKPDFAADIEQRQKFLSEAVVTGDLDHPNIVPIYDLGSNEAGALFYSMKRVRGTPWLDVLPKKSLPENLEILMKVADAVAFAHSRGVVHRDLKPENVMLGDFGEVLVMDWGLALSTTGFRKSDSITQSNSMGGTPAYMAPEMATGPIERVGLPSDIYLLGAILFEIITGKPPHTGRDVMSCLFAAARNQIQPTEHQGELLNLALEAMHTDPRQRFATVQIFQSAIRQYQSHSESIVLSSRAEHDLTQAATSNDYQDFSRALFGFQEAVALWDGNTAAHAGLSRAKLAYASAALQKGDLDLGDSLLDKQHPDHIVLGKKIRASLRERNARQQRLKQIRRIAVILGLAFCAVGAFSYLEIRDKRDIALQAEEQATMDRDRAISAEIKARDAATAATKESERARSAQAAAVASADEAMRAQMKAVEAAVSAQRAKDAEEYEAYVAEIGLAAARIDENAFDSAALLLEKSKRKLRHWEWGRLMHLCGQSVRTFKAHGPVDAVAFAPDGLRFATGSWDSTARVWNTQTGEMLLALPHEGLYVHAVTFSPDGKYLATGSSDKTGFVQIWDAQTGKLLRKLEGHKDAVTSVDFDQHGKRLLSASYDKTARVWDPETGKEIRSLIGHNWWLWSARFSPDGNRAVTASQDGAVLVWNLKSGQAGPPFTAHRGPVYAAAFSPDGKQVISGGYDKRVMIWSPDQIPTVDFEKLVAGQSPPEMKYRSFDGHTGAVWSVEFSADGKLLLSSGHDNSIKVWSADGGKLIKTLRGHAGWVRSCVFSPDGHEVLSASHDQTAMLWNIAGYEEYRVLQAQLLEGHADAVLSAQFSPDGTRIVTASRDRTAKIWNSANGKEVGVLEEGHAFLASTAGFFPDGKRMFTSAVDNTVRVWDLATGTQLLTLEHTGRSATAALSHDASSLLTGSDDLAARMWNADTGELQWTMPPQKAEITATAFSPDDRLVCCGLANGQVVLADAVTGAQVHLMNGHARKITAAAFSLASGRLLTASGDNTVGQWDVITGKELRTKTLKHPDGVTSLSLSADGARALTGCEDGQLRFWDVERSELLLTIMVQQNVHQSAAISADGRLALSADAQNRLVRLWDLQTGKEMSGRADRAAAGPWLDFQRLGGQIWSALFSPEGNRVLTVGGNGARLWDLATGNERMSFSPHGALASANFSPDGKRIVTGSWDNSARIWNAETRRAELKLMGQHSGYMNDAVFSPDGSKVLTASDDKTAVLWDAAKGESLLTFSGHQGRIRSATFSADGGRVLTASSDKTARIWDARTAELRGMLSGHAWGVLSAMFSADGRMAITGSEDNTAKIWDTNTEAEICTLTGHTASVTSVALSTDGLRALTGSQDNTVKLWDAQTGKEILTLKGHSQEVTSVSFSPNGKQVLSASRDGTAIVWLAVESGWGPESSDDPSPATEGPKF